MKNVIKLSLLVIFSLSLSSCGGDAKKEKKEKVKITTKKKEVKKVKTEKKEKTYDLSNKGIGPIKSITLSADIDQAMATKGAEVYKAKCTACHKVEKKFIGPSPKGIFKKRSPEWIMNMILNPDEMVKKDPIAKALLMEYNGSPMANQNLTEEEARSVLEYFRTL
ncbi:MAG: cytochrome c [Flavobacteriaceae bacterium]|nr:cytochrome c [Flavobacteriaceae bacterium]